MKAARPSRLRASFWATALTTSNRLRLLGRAGLRQADPDDEATGPVDQSIRPPTRRAYSRRQAEPPKSSIETPSGSPGHVGLVVVAAESEHDGARPELLDARPDLLEPVEDVGAREAGCDAPVDAADGLDHRARAGSPHDRVAGRDHERVARDPEAQLLLRRERDLLRRPRVRGLLRGRGRRALGGGRGRRRPVSGSAISVSISSASERPISAWTPLRGRSSRRAWLTSASGPVNASATSRSHAADLL